MEIVKTHAPAKAGLDAFSCSTGRHFRPFFDLFKVSCTSPPLGWLSMGLRVSNLYAIPWQAWSPLSSAHHHHCCCVLGAAVSRRCSRTANCHHPPLPLPLYSPALVNELSLNSKFLHVVIIHCFHCNSALLVPRIHLAGPLVVYRYLFSWHPSSSTASAATLLSCRRHTTASMEPAQLTAAVVSIVNTSRIILEYMQNGAKRCQHKDDFDEDMDTDIPESMGCGNWDIIAAVGLIDTVEC
ncbi:uncharacterized protein [Lepidochelys kempii]|uniref:uncharacterized protein isoform X3 n=1 Tax=Lepidochelys kempii TaxID=8472 RepID=UPI003C6F2D0F